jgi:CBS domain containing-hemolysin-like protein
MENFVVFIVDHWLLAALSAVSVLLAAFFAASETAIVFANKGHIRQLSEAGNQRAATVLRLLQQRDRLHSTLLFSENFFIALAVSFCTVAAFHMFSRSAIAVAVATVVMSVVVVLFAKLAPKGLAARNPDRLALIVAYPVLLVMKIVSPVARLLAAAADSFAGPGPQGMSCTAVVTEEDIKAMINLGEEGGSLKEEEKELLHKVFEFGDTLASEAMRPRTEIVNVPSNATLKEVFSLVSEFGYSRYPVIEDTIDTVIGILYIKDILVAMSAGEVKREDNIQQFIRPAYFIPENKRVSELLSEMQRERFQLAIVIDEFGGTSGLVTLEDLIEEIVGSIHDELETEEKEVQIVDEKNFVVSGQSALDEVNELLGTSLQSKDFNTLGGFVFGLFGRMPKVGEQLKYKNLKLEILELEGRKISKIKITKL